MCLSPGLPNRNDLNAKQLFDRGNCLGPLFSLGGFSLYNSMLVNLPIALYTSEIDDLNLKFSKPQTFDAQW